MLFHLFRLLGALLLLAGLPGQAAPETVGGRPLILEDMLQVEGVGAAAFDPQGRWLVFEKIRPYASIGDFSFGLYAFGRSGHQLWKLDLQGSEPAGPLPGLPEEEHSFMQSFSPDGRYLSLFQYKEGVVSLVVYDMISGTFRRARSTPALSRAAEHVPVWVSRTRIAYAALPDGVQPGLSSVRPYAGALLADAWQAAWRGDRVTAIEVSTGDGALPAPEPPGRLVVFDAVTGEESVLSEGLHVDLRGSPDGRYLSALRVSAAPDPGQGLLQESDRRRYRLEIFDLRTGEVHSPENGLNLAPLTLVWHPASGRLAVFGWPEESGREAGEFYLMDANGKTLAVFPHTGLDLVSERERGWRQRPERAAFFGDALAVYARPLPDDPREAGRFSYKDVRPENTQRGDWYAVEPGKLPHNISTGLPDEAATLLHAGDHSLSVLSASGAYTLTPDASPRRITPDLSGIWRQSVPGTLAARRGVARPEFQSDVILTRENGGATDIALINFSKAPRPQLLLFPGVPGATRDLITASSGAGKAVFMEEKQAASNLVLAGSRPSRALQILTGINHHLDGVDPGRWVRVTYPADPALPKGRTLESCLLLPPGFDPKTPPALIVEVYPGAGPACTEGQGRISGVDPHSPYIWSGKGFAYSRVSAPTDIIRTPSGPIAGMPALMETALDAFVSGGYVDPERTVLTGFSQGGVSALFVAAHSARFKAVIVKNSWVDFTSHYFEGAGIFSIIQEDGLAAQFQRYEALKGSDFSMGLTPYQAPHVYRSNSPLHLAGDINVPVLLFHSDLDGFAMGQFDAMYAALLRLGKSVTYVRYLGEGHGPSSPANIRHMWGRKQAFLETHGLYPGCGPAAVCADRSDQPRNQHSIP